MFELVKKLNKNFENLSLNDIVPYQFTLPASPYIAKGNSNIDIDFLKKQKVNFLHWDNSIEINGII
jgi:dethiobiotin synthetase